MVPRNPGVQTTMGYLGLFEVVWDYPWHPQILGRAPGLLGAAWLFGVAQKSWVPKQSLHSGGNDPDAASQYNTFCRSHGFGWDEQFSAREE